MLRVGAEGLTAELPDDPLERLLGREYVELPEEEEEDELPLWGVTLLV